MTRACFTGLKHMTMNHTINVSIAGVAFVLDSEGYELLKDYLVRIEVAYKDDPDGAEILSDIEARVSELILNRQSSDMIVSPELIREIIGQLGWPDGVTAQGPAGGAEMPENGADNAISRRLYRNPDGAKLGGVCNGLATYFRVDPTLVRLLFCSPLLILVVISVIPVVNALCGFFGTLIGVSFLLYLILWFAIPKARTPRQRLEMTGERITASSIRRNISADLNDARPSPRNERTASVFSELLYVTGRVLLFCIKAFLLLIGAVLGLVVLGLVVGLVTMLIGGAAVGFPFALAGGSLLIPVLIVLGIVLPLGIVVYLLLKLVFNLRSRRTTLSALFGIWVLILLGNAERAIMKHSHSADSLLGVGIDVKIQDNWLFVDIADRNFHFKGKLSELAGAVELKRVVLLYVNAQQTFIIPKRALPDEAYFMRCLAHIPADRFIRESDGSGTRRFAFWRRKK